MKGPVFFSASSRVWDTLDWVFGIEELGYRGWEIVADGKYRFDAPEHFQEIRDTLAATTLRASVHAPYSDLNIASVNDPIWKESVRQVCACIDRAAMLEVGRVTFHPGYLSPVGKLVPERAWAAQKEALVRIGHYAEERGILACLENMGGVRDFLCRYPEEILGMTEGIDGIGVTIDIGHAHTVGKVAAFLPFLAQARHLHLHDNHGEHDEHLALGDGTIDWKAVGKAAAAYEGIAVVEGRSLAEAARSLALYRRWFL
jgi:sugar phosphate isomerase/epimerase